MDDLRELYMETILDHNKRPRNFGPLDGSHQSADGHNPLCGDRVKVHVRLEGDTVTDLRFEGDGCAISKASASMMTEAVKGLPRDEIDTLFHLFQGLVMGRSEADPDELGKLAVFVGVREFPMRVKCATLAWHTLNAALTATDTIATTE